MRPRIFGMVSLKPSLRYTVAALRTFFATTTLREIDRFILIDNDGSFGDGSFVDVADRYERMEVVVPPRPQSFAENANYVMRIAEAAQGDLYFLNNDLYFFPGWLEPLTVDLPTILSPFTNRELTHLGLQNTMSLGDVEGKEDSFKPVIQRLQREGGLKPVITFAYACVKIPYSVYSRVGPFDETFGRGGAEDGDYSIRAQILGHGVAYVTGSFVVHFNGKSTWCGAESEAESDERVTRFRARFTDKWGIDLARLFVAYDNAVLQAYPEVMQDFTKGDLAAGVKKMAAARWR